MRKYIAMSLIAACLCLNLSAQELRTPAPSPGSNLKQEFALSEIEVSYSRPAIRGRKIFGDLVPFGKVWRTGANGATTISFGEDISFGDKAVPAGKYGLLTIPNAKEWTIILTKQLDVTSPAAYKQDQDLVRITVPTIDIPMSIENFMIVFDNVTPNSAELTLLWEKTAVAIPLKSAVDEKIMAQINDAMTKDNKPYFESAMYYMQNNKDLKQAAGWFDKAAEQNPSAFWVYYQRASCYAKLGRKQDAISSANKSIELAKAAKNDDYVALNQKLLSTLK